MSDLSEKPSSEKLLWQWLSGYPILRRSLFTAIGVVGLLAPVVAAYFKLNDAVSFVKDEVVCQHLKAPPYLAGKQTLDILVTRLANDPQHKQTEYLTRAIKDIVEDKIQVSTYCKAFLPPGKNDTELSPELNRLSRLASPDLIVIGNVEESRILHLYMHTYPVGDFAKYRPSAIYTLDRSLKADNSFAEAMLDLLLDQTETHTSSAYNAYITTSDNAHQSDLEVLNRRADTIAQLRAASKGQIYCTATAVLGWTQAALAFATENRDLLDQAASTLNRVAEDGVCPNRQQTRYRLGRTLYALGSYNFARFAPPPARPLICPSLESACYFEKAEQALSQFLAHESVDTNSPEQTEARLMLANTLSYLGQQKSDPHVLKQAIQAYEAYRSLVSINEVVTRDDEYKIQIANYNAALIYLKLFQMKGDTDSRDIAKKLLTETEANFARLRYYDDAADARSALATIETSKSVRPPSQHSPATKRLPAAPPHGSKSSRPCPFPFFCP